MNKRLVVGSGLAMGCLLVLGSCNDPSEQPGTQSASMPFSDWSMGCESGSQQQQQQVSYGHPEQQQSCTKQSVEFPQQGISDFHFDVDCDSRKVQVTQLGDGSGAAASGRAFRTESFPMRADDSFKGQMGYQQQIPKDGKGNMSCWVEYVVIFDGKCSCERRDDGGWKKGVDVTSTVALQSANPMGGGHPSPLPSVSPQPSASPSPSPSPSDMPSPEPSEEPSPSPTPSMSPSPHPSVSPRPSVTPTVVPIVFCVVDNNACPYVGDGHMKCD